MYINIYILSSMLGLLGAPWAQLGASWASFGLQDVLTGVFWAQFRAFWASPESNLGLSTAFS